MTARTVLLLLCTLAGPAQTKPQRLIDFIHGIGGSD